MIVYAVIILTFAILMLVLRHRIGNREERLPSRLYLAFAGMSLAMWVTTSIQAWQYWSEPYGASYLLIAAAALCLGNGVMFLAALREGRLQT